MQFGMMVLVLVLVLGVICSKGLGKRGPEDKDRSTVWSYLALSLSSTSLCWRYLLLTINLTCNAVDIVCWARFVAIMRGFSWFVCMIYSVALVALTGPLLLYLSYTHKGYIAPRNYAFPKEYFAVMALMSNVLNWGLVVNSALVPSVVQSGLYKLNMFFLPQLVYPEWVNQEVYTSLNPLYQRFWEALLSCVIAIPLLPTAFYASLASVEHLPLSAHGFAQYMSAACVCLAGAQPASHPTAPCGHSWVTLLIMVACNIVSDITAIAISNIDDQNDATHHH